MPAEDLSLEAESDQVHDEPDDDALMRAFARGDAGAFERLFERHRRPLFTYLLHQLGDRARAEDLFQEVFLRVVRAGARYRGTGEFRAWLFTIARNGVTDAHRRDAMRRVGAPNEGETAMPNENRSERAARASLAAAVDGRPEPSAAAANRELRERLATALAALPEKQREVFLLHQRAGLDLASIARVTDSALATVKSRMRYALAGLRQRLAGELALHTEALHE